MSFLNDSLYGYNKGLIDGSDRMKRMIMGLIEDRAKRCHDRDSIAASVAYEIVKMIEEQAIL